MDAFLSRKLEVREVIANLPYPMGGEHERCHPPTSRVATDICEKQEKVMRRLPKLTRYIRHILRIISRDVGES